MQSFKSAGEVTPILGTLEFGAVTLEAAIEFKAGGVIETGVSSAVELEKPLSGLGVEELEISVGVGVRLMLFTPIDGVLTLEGSEALAMAVLELWVDALETGVQGGTRGLQPVNQGLDSIHGMF